MEEDTSEAEEDTSEAEEETQKLMTLKKNRNGN